MSFTFVLVFVAAYLAGSLNFSILLFRVTGKGDPRARFSGNPGVTNVYRQEGPLWAAAILLLDLLRASTVALVAMHLCSTAQLPWCALALVAGNMYPAFHGFRGGKGVSNYLGFTLIPAPEFTALAAATWLILFGLLRQPFLGSFGMVAVLSLGLARHADNAPGAVTGVVIVTAWIIFAHRANLSRYYRGREKG